MTWNHKPAEEKPYIQLICHPYEDASSVNTRITIDVMEKDLSRDDLIEVFQDFLKAMGYRLSEKEYLTIDIHP